MKTGLKYALVQNLVKKPTNYLTGYQQAEILKDILEKAPGVHMLVVLETNTGLNGWWNLTQNITGKVIEQKQ